MANNSGGLVGKKRGRSDEEHVQSSSSSSSSCTQPLGLENNLTFSDTVVALQMMRAQFPKVDKVQPLILRSQLYSSVKDRTQVDRDLESLKKEKTVRVFKLNTGNDDNAIMFTNDYIIQMENSVKRLDVKDEELGRVFEWFKLHVIELKTDASIDHAELCSLLSNGGKVVDKHVTLLINAGLLIRQLIDHNVYWFAIPNIGPVLKGLSQGRKEILSLIKNTKYKEMMMANLEKRRLRFSPLDVRFHLRDLIGSGLLKTVQSPMGLLVRLSRD